MSNERKCNLKLGAIQVIAAERAARCADCLPAVKFDGGKLLVRHSEGCWYLDKLRASGEAHGGMGVFFGPDGQVECKPLSMSHDLSACVAVFSDTFFGEG